MADKITPTGSFDEAIASYLTRGPTLRLMMRWDLVQIYGALKSVPGQIRAGRAQTSKKRWRLWSRALRASIELVVVLAMLLWAIWQVGSAFIAWWPVESGAAQVGVRAASVPLVSLVSAIGTVGVQMSADRLLGHRIIWRRQGSAFAALRIARKKSGRHEIHGLGKWPIRKSESTDTVAEELRGDLKDMADATIGTVLTTSAVEPKLRAMYISEGMRPATAQECTKYRLDLRKDPLIYRPHEM
ncbi:MULTISPECIES: hypothetical protein [Rhodococcus]|uniref:hypothetical protein n=1 Tax=Rhodococcus TaxID=1827 RepID=UPI0006418BA5|nr:MULTISPECIES: hypothetical protein [Rhodococcus]KLN71419.1 hypothetical protein ABM90_12195 [Rhodococcus erythropolis]NHP18606.1 hypothetical protein [Rhodococcus sp. IC4_135]KSU61994.1 hypothetical protein AS032_33995 [Rhodococcus qingshengii]OFE09788.1 hypothetical protein A5N83_05925 [Rhodococcus sp. 1139]SCC70393.1 hypothetical protein GA0061093_14123 [Rhodococcus qingshengii]